MAAREEMGRAAVVMVVAVEERKAARAARALQRRRLRAVCTTDGITSSSSLCGTNFCVAT